MKISTRRVILLAAAVAAFTAGLSWNGTSAVDTGFVTSAEARIGRPLAVGAAAGAAGAYYGSPCVQVVDAYGRVTTRC
jgi:hypothetical protein